MAKHWYLFVLAFMLLASCDKRDAAPIPSHTKSCDEILSETDSLLLLAMQLEYEGIINATDTAGQSDVLLSTDKFEKIYNALLAIKALQTPDADTVFNRCKVQGYYDDTLMRRFVLRMKKSSCADYLIYNGVVYQPCALGDSLIFRYNARAEKYVRELVPGSATDYQYIINFRACKPLNIAALLKQIKKSSWIDGAISFPSFTIKPLRITLDETPAYTDYEFGYGWGNCSPGCYNWRYWKFRVDTANKATFIQSYGDNGPPL